MTDGEAEFYCDDHEVIAPTNVEVLPAQAKVVKAKPKAKPKTSTAKVTTKDKG